MFTWLNKKGVQGDTGFVVQGTGRFTIEYREEAKKITVYVEPDILPDGRFCEIIRADAFSKWDHGEIVFKEKQKKILKNFIAAMDCQRVGVIVA